MISLTAKDFECIGQVAKHCDLTKLKIAINEAIKFDGRELLCGLFYDVNENWRSKDDEWVSLINGSTYTGCGSNSRSHSGIKEVLVYYAYARYVLINKTDDTASGMVSKSNDFSIPTPMKEIIMISNRYRNMAKQLWLDVEAFICINSNDYPTANGLSCKPCGCNGSCKSGINTRGFGLSGKNVSKYGL
ncbi:MAG TPA: hypothetical protein VKY45_02940 [Marinilabiliaceae bacterium]|nr:hypothetical protein [Marinilabiliaceae bacterium]